jgi:hypothetical protein
MSQEAIDAGTVIVPAGEVKPAGDAASVVLPSETTPETTLLAGKYKTPADLEKAYKELEKKLGAPKPDAAKPDAAKPDAVKPGTTPEGIAEGVVAEAGLDMTTLSTEFAEKGELSAESLAKLAKVGIPKEMVDDYIAGQEARAVAQVGKVHALVGGEAEYKTLLTWAAANVSEADKAVFNKHINGDFDSQRLVVEALHGKYIKATGSAPKIISGEATPPSTSGYESRAQMTADMSDPRYAKDPAFRAKVEQKVAKTTAF